MISYETPLFHWCSQPGMMQHFLFLNPRHWSQALAISVLASSITAWFTAWISPWISVAVGIWVMTVLHMAWSERVVVSLPHIAILVGALQYVFGAWINFYWPPTNPTYDLGDRLPLYLSYAGPVLIAIALGWMLALVRLRPLMPPEETASPGVLLELDLLLAIGVLAMVAARLVHIASLSFVFLLLGNLRYVSAYGRMLLRGRGWTWRLALVLGAEVLFAAGSAMFHDLLLWSLWTFALLIYKFRPRPLRVLTVVVVGVFLLPALQESKWQLRQDRLFDHEMSEEHASNLAETPLMRAGAWLSYLGSSFIEAVTFNLDTDFVADIAVRYNQGWIINRIMVIVPDTEPYAEGATLKDAAIAAILPRFIAEEKVVAGGNKNMAQYARMELGESTAMNLGLAGEMYANFGYTGGIVACGVYAFLFGLLFRALCHRAFVRPLWWALVPFMFYAAVKAEDDVAFVLNWTVKGSIVLFVVMIIMPNFRRALRRGESSTLRRVSLPDPVLHT
jgi:hypothetical protein